MDRRSGGSTVADQYPSHGLDSVAKSWHDLVPRPYFDPATVVTRSRTGDPVSHYGDDPWDFRAQSRDASTAQTLYFWRAPQSVTDHVLVGRIYEQHKALVWVIANRGDIKTFNTLLNYCLTARECCTIAYDKGVDLFTLLTDFEEVGAICDEMRASRLTAINGLVRALWRYRRELLPSEAQMQRDKIIEEIRAAKAKLPAEKQTPLIPSRIYCSILAGLLEGLDEIERNLDFVLDSLCNSVETTVTFMTRRPQASREQLSIERRKALAESRERMRGLGWKQGPGKTLHMFIIGKITAYQTHLMHTVVAFSGMRVGEVKLLPLNGVLETFQHRGRTTYVIKGYTHKLHRGVKVAAEWVTIDQGHRAIRLATRIGQALLSLHGEKPRKGQEALLFPSTSIPFKMMGSMPFTRAQERLMKAISPEITVEDLDELNRLELERGWGRNGIELGKRWPLTMHQLRRSLSVYAHRSGMVSLPALKAQLQHITDEMRAYYADGWSRAVNLVFDNNHFSHEWNAAKAESTYFGLTAALKIALDEGDDLLGRGAQRLEQIISGRSRHQTFVLIKSGTLAYRETVLGGCVSTEECTVMPLDPINFECVESNCVNVVVRSKRLDMVIGSQESVVAQLASDKAGSVEQRLEVEHLKRMLLARDRLRQTKNEAAKEVKA